MSNPNVGYIPVRREWFSKNDVVWIDKLLPLEQNPEDIHRKNYITYSLDACGLVEVIEDTGNVMHIRLIKMIDIDEYGRPKGHESKGRGRGKEGADECSSK